MATNELSLWYNSIPQMTRYWFTGSVVLPLLGRFGIINANYLILDFAATFRHFQVRHPAYLTAFCLTTAGSLQLWRPITALFYFPISPRTGFHYLLNLYFLYNYSSQLESGECDYSNSRAGCEAYRFLCRTFCR